MSDNMIATGGNNHLDTAPLGSLLDQAMGVDSNPSVVPDPIVPQTQQQEMTTFDVARKQSDDVVVEPQSVVTPDTQNQSVERQVFDVPDNAFVKVKLDGQEVEVPYQEFRDSLQREAAYTKRSQQLALQRKQAEQEIVNQYAWLQQQAQALEMQRQQLANQKPLAQQLAELAQPQQTQPKSDELATIGEVRQTVEQQLAQQQQQYARQIAELEQRFQQQQLNERQQLVRQKDADRFTSALQTILQDPSASALSLVTPTPQYAEAIIRHKVASMDATTIDEAIENARIVVKEWAGNINKQTLGQRQQVEAQRARAVLEPNQGSPAPPAKPPQHQTIFKKTGEVDWNALSQRAHAMATTLDA